MSKVKTTGKIIAVVLCCAVVFFLLLPFLDNPRATASADGKKPSPQIFTSNPLTDLVNKIYALVTGGKKRAGSRAAAAGTEPGEATPLSPAQWTADARRSAQNARPSASSTSSYPATYDYADAGMINEDGEWVLVRQTAPDAAQRGMHDIKSSDTPYDRLVRQERAAKFTGAPSAAGKSKRDIPVSKWARLWNPVKNFFTGEEDSVPETDAPQRALLASASSGLNGARGGRASSGRAAAKPGLNMAEAGKFNFTTGDTPQALSLAEILTPEIGLERIKENLLEHAKNEMGKEDRAKLEQLLNEKTKELVLQTKQNFQDKIQKEAQGKKPENLLELTFDDCGVSALYSTRNHSSCPPPPNKEQREQMREQMREATENANAQNFKELQKYLGVALPSQPQVLVVLGKTQEINPNLDPAEADDQAAKKQATKKFYDFALQQKGCEENDCIWVANQMQPDLHLRTTVEGAGLHFLADPQEQYQQLAQAFLEQQINDDSDEATQIIFDFQSNKFSPPAYVPYTREEWLELSQRNSPENLLKNPKGAFFVFGESPQLAKMMEDGLLPNPGLTLRDPKGEILNSDAPSDDADKFSDDLENRAPRLHEKAKNLIDDYKEIAHNAGQELTELGLTEIARARLRRVKEEMERNQGQGLDERMGL